MQIPTDEEIIKELEKQGVEQKYHAEGISAVKNCMEQDGWGLERSVKLIAKYATLNSSERS
ncbi:hypothetical protein SAMN05428988_0175 [Chitinophaga sp. YR573]|uniref:hypothetical protein n=1 Tax=Chitinophaga sp. YR573 TaxID=1881040 RepID=UPI0008BDB2DB|nr:hypothetical protein [Chitinophaga sp. YR573]SEV89094.1 hypothetical protein SAMN05428988_0175 [Chitinophaga sp. YR573]